MNDPSKQIKREKTAKSNWSKCTKLGKHAANNVEVQIMLQQCLNQHHV